MVTDDALPELRASDADREQTAEILRHAAGEGRLTFDELEERLNQVYETRTHRELDRLTADVVPTPHGRPVQARIPVRTGEDEGAGWLISIMSGRDRKGRWRVGRHLKVVDIMGGSNLDLNDAELSAHETQITVVAIMGGSEIRVPEGVNVRVSEFAFMGGNDCKLGDELPDPGGPTIHLKMVSIMGGSSVKRGRKLSRAERKALKHSGH
jgi:Domain of unknown function (DUF1707)/Cell wall-active antibiotics response 4TMS YvqF